MDEFFDLVLLTYCLVFCFHLGAAVDADGKVRCKEVAANAVFKKYQNGTEDFKASWDEAQRQCAKHNSFLMEGPLPCRKYLDFGGEDLWVGVKRINHFFQTCGPTPTVFTISVPTAKVQNPWWTPGHPKYDCVAINMNRESLGSYITFPCDKKLPFVCVSKKLEKKFDKVTKINVKITPDYIKPIPRRNTSEITLKCTATGFLSSIKYQLNTQRHGIRYAWSKDGVFVDNYIRVLIPSLVFLKSRPRQAFTDPETRTTSNEQGVYQCYVLLPGNSTWIPSNKVVIKFSDVDTVLLTLTNVPFFNQTEHSLSAIGYQRFVDQTFASFVQDVVIENSRDEVFNYAPDDWDVSAMWAEPSGNTYIRLLLYYLSSRGLVDDDVRLETFRKKVRLSLEDYRNMDVQIRQAEFCETEFSSKFELQWPRTKVLMGNVSDVPCVTENLELLERKCNLDYENGPYWSDHEPCISLSSRFDEEIPMGPKCPQGFVMTEGNDCKRYGEQRMSWDEATHSCKQDFAFLLSKTYYTRQNEMQNIWIDNLIFAQNNLEPYIWLNDEEPKHGKDCIYVTGIEKSDRPKIILASSSCSAKRQFVCSSQQQSEELMPVFSRNRKFGVSIRHKLAYEVNVKTKASWTEAVSICQSAGGDLVSFSHRNLMHPVFAFVQEAISNHLRGDTKLWIGLQKTNGTYKWNTGQKLSYEMWARSTEFSPENVYGQLSVVAIPKFDIDELVPNYNKRAQWNLGSVHQQHGFICQYDLSSNNIQFDRPEISFHINEGRRGRIGYQALEEFEAICTQTGIVPNTTVFYKDEIALTVPGLNRMRFINFFRDKLQNFENTEISLFMVQGYYWCEGLSIINRNSVSSKKHLFTVPDTITYICSLTMKDSTNFKFWHRGPTEPKYLSLLKTYDHQVRTQLLQYGDIGQGITQKSYNAQVTGLHRQDDGTVLLVFHIYRPFYRPMARKRQVPNQRYDFVKENLQLLKSRAKNPDYFNDTSSMWLKANEVQASSITFRHSGKCPKDWTFDGGRTLIWPQRDVGESTMPSVDVEDGSEVCITRGGDPVVRHCLGNFTIGAYWGDVIGRCNGKPSNITLQLKELNNSRNSSDVTASKLTNLTTVTKSLRAIDIGLIADIVQHIDATEQVVDHKVLSNVVSSMNNVLAVNETILLRSQNLLKTSSRFLQTLEGIMSKVELNKTSPNVSVINDNLAVEVWKISDDDSDPIVGIADLTGQGFKAFDLMTLRNSSYLDYNQTKAAIKLPANQISFEQREIGDLMLKFVVFQNTKLFLSDHLIGNINEKSCCTHGTSHMINTPVISASIKGMKESRHLDPPVEIIFQPMKNVDEDGNSSTCVYWDLAANDGLGGWSANGCYLDRLMFGRLVCKCNHLTNFAVLVDLYGQESQKTPIYHRVILEVITYVGCFLSICGLLLTICTFLFYKEWRKQLTSQIHVSLAFALLMAVGTFVLGTEKSWHTIVHTCIATAALLHYFLLAAFFWMLVEAIQHYLLFVRYMNSHVPGFMKKAMVIAWGLPLLIVVPTLIVDPGLYDGGKYYCWMSLRGFYYAFLLPMAVIIFTNILLFVRIAFALVFDRQRKKFKMRTNQPEKQDLRRRFYATLGIFVLSGSTWVFAFFAISDARLLFQYLFCIFNSTQGFFIFFLMVYKQRKARSYWVRQFRTCFKKDDGSQFSSSGTNKSAYLHDKMGTANMNFSASSSSNDKYTTSSGVAYSRKVNAVNVLPKN